MRIGNGPRLVIQRPGTSRYRGCGRRYFDRGRAYDEWRAMERARLRGATPPAIACKPKRPVRPAQVYLKQGASFRSIDGHGRTYGPRLDATSDLPPFTRVRRVARQEEDLHSRMSRILKAAHRFALRTE